MSYHLRRLDKATADAIRAQLPDTDDYSRAAQFTAKSVGEDAGYYYFDVQGEDRDLPGEFLAASYEALTGAVADVILEAKWDEEVDGIVQEKRDKIAHVPDGATIKETRLRAHEWME